jgi:hypothetical protein
LPVLEGVARVKAEAVNSKGRRDSSIGAVVIANLKGENLANALMKCETKAKRRVTLSICGLSFLDEEELETVAGIERIGPQKSMKLAGMVAQQPAPVESNGVAHDNREVPVSFITKKEASGLWELARDRATALDVPAEDIMSGVLAGLKAEGTVAIPQGKLEVAVDLIQAFKAAQ